MSSVWLGTKDVSLLRLAGEEQQLLCVYQDEFVNEFMAIKNRDEHAFGAAVLIAA
jgi:hypothetical protein